MEHIGHAAWRVLQNARKAAIARRESADAERRGDLLISPGKLDLETTRRQGASAAAGELGELERARRKNRRPAG